MQCDPPGLAEHVVLALLHLPPPSAPLYHHTQHRPGVCYRLQEQYYYLYQGYTVLFTWNLASHGWLPGFTYTCMLLPPVRLAGQATHLELTPCMCPGAAPPVRARHAGPPRSCQPWEQAPHLSTTVTMITRPWYSSSTQLPQANPSSQSAVPTAVKNPSAEIIRNNSALQQHS